MIPAWSIVLSLLILFGGLGYILLLAFNTHLAIVREIRIIAMIAAKLTEDEDEDKNLTD